jgi:hypothetical protein
MTFVRFMRATLLLLATFAFVVAVMQGFEGETANAIELAFVGLFAWLLGLSDILSRS